MKQLEGKKNGRGGDVEKGGGGDTSSRKSDAVAKGLSQDLKTGELKRMRKKGDGGDGT